MDQAVNLMTPVLYLINWRNGESEPISRLKFFIPWLLQFDDFMFC